MVGTRIITTGRALTSSTSAPRFPRVACSRAPPGSATESSLHSGSQTPGTPSPESPTPLYRSRTVTPTLTNPWELGTDTNPPEADYIVGKIAELCADQRYDGKTYGVISLLGDGQAQLIQGKLIDRLGEQEVERRRIRCGNAYHFQGDERHVMFLSLVVAAGEGRRIGAMTKDADRQRINVAASRAKDQMWCIRSISPDELHPDDVRSRFIRYCQTPARIDDATGQAEDLFDSDFERDVYRHLIARGYRVKVQRRVGRFRIDLVVESRRGRLAVELDGDAYHGPDRWEAHRNRQGILGHGVLPFAPHP